MTTPDLPAILSCLDTNGIYLIAGLVWLEILLLAVNQLKIRRRLDFANNSFLSTLTHLVSTGECHARSLLELSEKIVFWQGTMDALGNAGDFDRTNFCEQIVSLTDRINHQEKIYATVGSVEGIHGLLANQSQRIEEIIGNFTILKFAVKRLDNIRKANEKKLSKPKKKVVNGRRR